LVLGLLVLLLVANWIMAKKKPGRRI